MSVFCPLSSENANPLITAASPNFSRSRSIAYSASAARRSSRSERSSPSATHSPDTPMPIRRNCVPSISRASNSRPVAKILAASWVGRSNDCARVRSRKSLVLSLSVTVVPASSEALRRAETFSESRNSRCTSGRMSAMSRSKVVSAEMLLVSRSAWTARSSRPWARR